MKKDIQTSKRKDKFTFSFFSLPQNDIADVPSGNSKNDKKGKGKGDTVKTSVTPQASSDMAQTSNSAQNNTSESKKGKKDCFAPNASDLHCDLIWFVVDSARSDATLVPNASIEDLKQTKVGVKGFFFFYTYI